MPGHALAEELARRLGREKCFRVNWPVMPNGQQVKDANEALMKLGELGLREAVEVAKELPPYEEVQCESALAGTESFPIRPERDVVSCDSVTEGTGLGSGSGNGLGSGSGSGLGSRGRPPGLSFALSGKGGIGRAKLRLSRGENGSGFEDVGSGFRLLKGAGSGRPGSSQGSGEAHGPQDSRTGLQGLDSAFGRARMQMGRGRVLSGRLDRLSVRHIQGLSTAASGHSPSAVRGGHSAIASSDYAVRGGQRRGLSVAAGGQSGDLVPFRKGGEAGSRHEVIGGRDGESLSDKRVSEQSAKPEAYAFPAKRWIVGGKTGGLRRTAKGTAQGLRSSQADSGASNLISNVRARAALSSAKKAAPRPLGLGQLPDKVAALSLENKTGEPRNKTGESRSPADAELPEVTGMVLAARGPLSGHVQSASELAPALMASRVAAGLNEEQAAAVLAPVGPVRVVAGPGSGKTKVLTNRVAHLVLDHRVPPWNMLVSLPLSLVPGRV